MMDAFFHEEGLIKRRPQEITDIVLEGLSNVAGEDPVEITLPAEDARGYLVKQGLERFAYRDAREGPVNGLVQKTAVFYLTYDVERK